MTSPDPHASPPALLKTPLHALHVELGAKMVPFAGYAMPVSYPQGILAEHRRCRESAVLFDVSHMGQLRLRGADAAAALEPHAAPSERPNVKWLPLTEALGLEPAGLVRIGMLHYNTSEETDRLLTALAGLA